MLKPLIGKPEGKRQTESPSHRCKNNIKMYLRQAVLEGMDWIIEPSGFVKGGDFLD
jgi:hypothetical protein